MLNFIILGSMETCFIRSSQLFDVCLYCAAVEKEKI